MKVFVTGATGFIGKNTVKRLVETGQECICLVRSTSKIDALEKIGCLFFKGDIMDRESLTKGMQECESVINLANLYSYWEPDVSLYEKINIEGTRNVLETALASGMKKVIHVSSIVTWGRTSVVPLNEESPIGEHPSEYARTKYEGDKVAWELYETKGLPLVMIYPCAVLGADDPKSTGDVIKQIINRKMPLRAMESAAMTWVHVKDAAEATVRALEKDGNIGEGYIIGKEQLSMGQFNKTVSEVSGVPLPFLSIPNAMLKFKDLPYLTTI